MCVRACMLNRFSCVRLSTPWTVACQAPLSMGILQARILEWVAIPFSRGSSQPKDQTCISYIAGRFFTTELPGIFYYNFKKYCKSWLFLALMTEAFVNWHRWSDLALKLSEAGMDGMPFLKIQKQSRTQSTSRLSSSNCAIH